MCIFPWRTEEESVREESCTLLTKPEIWRSIYRNTPNFLGEFTQQQIEDIRLRLQDFAGSFQNNQFTGLYTLQGSLQNTLLFNTEEGENTVQKALSQLGISYTVMDAEEAGIVSYTIDGYEDFQKEKLTAEILQNAQSSVNYAQKRRSCRSRQSFI